jgi:hypothetical protein
MRWLPLLLLTMLLQMGSLKSQNAVNFNVKDCGGNTVDLYEQLNAGKVIVLCWVMPCGSCILPATTAYNVTMSYQQVHPGKVEMYVIDDYANTSCSDINNWCFVYQLDSTRRFSNSAIKMSDYGSAGMPKTVVVGGVWGKVYFNQNNAVNANNLQDAIDLALTETGIEKPAAPEGGAYTLFPNPVITEGTLHMEVTQSAVVQITLHDLLGRQMKEIHHGNLAEGSHEIVFQVSDLIPGTYIVQIASDQGFSTRKMVVGR